MSLGFVTRPGVNVAFAMEENDPVLGGEPEKVPRSREAAPGKTELGLFCSWIKPGKSHSLLLLEDAQPGCWFCLRWHLSCGFSSFMLLVLQIEFSDVSYRLT